MLIRSLLLLMLGGTIGFSALNVPLEVSNWADAARTGEPVSAGIPLPVGGIYDLSKLRITDGSGATVPAQFYPLSRWWRERAQGIADSPSVKWVLCDFQASVAAKSKASFFLKDGNSSAPSTDLTLTQDNAKVTVVTGPLKFTISKTSFNLFDEAWLDADNSNSFESAEKIIASTTDNGGFITAGDWQAGACTTGTVHSSAAHSVERIVVEEQGPMKVLLRVEGRHYATTGGVAKGLYGYQVFITAYAGKSYVDVQWAVTNLYMEGTKPGQTGTADPYKVYAWPFTAYALNVNMNLNLSGQTYALLGASEVTGSAATSPVRLLQKSGAYTITGAAGGTEALGGAALTDGTLGLMVTERDFGPNNPKAITVSRNRLSLELFPDTGAGVKYWLDPYSRKNHRMRFNFFSGAFNAGALLAQAKATDAPLRMLAPRQWYQATHAWYRGYGIPPNPELARKEPSTWTRMTKSSSELVKNVDDNDYLPNNWSTAFQTGNFNSGGDHWNLTSCFWNYLNNGNPQDFEYPEAVALNCNDMVPVQFSWYEDPWVKLDWFLNAENHLVGLNSYHGPTNNIIYNGDYVTFPGWAYHRSNIPDGGHMTNLQMLEYYELTGDHATRDYIRAMGVRAVAGIMGGAYFTCCPVWAPRRPAVLDSIYIFGGQQRYISRPGIVVSQAYDVTGDTRFLRAMDLSAYSMRNFARQNPSGYLAEAGNRSYLYSYDDAGLLANWQTRHPTDTAVPVSCHSNDFMEGIAHEWLYDYYDKTGDKEIRDALILATKSMEQRAGMNGSTYTGFIYAGYGDWLYEGKRYSDCPGLGTPGFNVSMAEAFGGFIFGYLVSGRPDFWKVMTDGYTANGSTFNGEMKYVNIWEAIYKHDSLDITPPAKVTDLRYSYVPGSGIRISWTAPGDDNVTGQAASYRIKVGSAPLVDCVKRWDAASQTGWPDMRAPLPYTVTDLIAKEDHYKETREISFWAAHAVSGEPSPAAAGTAESMLIPGLDTMTNTYIALVTYDKAGNVSEISNVVSTKNVVVETGESGECTIFTLESCIPNPFNPSTTIRFNVPRASAAHELTLAIYDIRGQKVRTLLNGAAAPGRNRIVWDGKDDNGHTASSSLYFCRLEGKTVVKQIRMTMLK